MEKCLCCRERKRNSYGNICENAKLATCLERERLYRAGLERAMEIVAEYDNFGFEMSPEPYDIYQNGWQRAVDRIYDLLRDELEMGSDD